MPMLEELVLLRIYNHMEYHKHYVKLTLLREWSYLAKDSQHPILPLIYSTHTQILDLLEIDLFLKGEENLHHSEVV